MKAISEFNYRNAKEIIQQSNPKLLNEIYKILNDEENKLSLESREGKKQRDTSKQIKQFFLLEGWKEEQKCKAIPEMKYDLLKDENFPIEIEVGHMRLVYADFFEYLADYSKGFIKAAIMIVCNDPVKFGFKWQNSIKSTKNKIEKIKETFLVPVLVIGIEP
jgi:hypothetical protein